MKSSSQRLFLASTLRPVNESMTGWFLSVKIVVRMEAAGAHLRQDLLELVHSEPNQAVRCDRNRRRCRPQEWMV